MALNDVNITGNALSTSKTTAKSSTQTTDSQASTVSAGGNLSASAGHDLTVAGSSVVAYEVAVIGGKPTAIEAKFVDDWASSIRNPESMSGSKPWAVAEQTKMVDQAKKYSSGFDGGAIYHTNSPELATYYSKVFTNAGVTNFKFVITPVIK
ncbi:hemagglutinin repeat-containing protein [Rahnella sp. Larv3_ips]|uniref:hemagglutinin repeat-containing protein n=1 Tax=Rahnella sp. Larv3_ips TaxID=1896943 RepID=UPI0013CE436A|nr:hemagglutinin repeat-containing protein [Rahnella sp. Larv3_ips]